MLFKDDSSTPKNVRYINDYQKLKKSDEASIPMAVEFPLKVKLIKKRRL